MNWSFLLMYGDLNYYYSVNYQPLLFAHINSRYKCTIHSNRKFWNTATVKQLSSGQGIWIKFRWCWHRLELQGKQLWIACQLYLYALFPNVHCTRSHQLRLISTCVTDYTHKFAWYTSQMLRISGTIWV